jgi:hypothetical protein
MALGRFYRTDRMQMMEASEVLAEYHQQVLPVHHHAT